MYIVYMATAVYVCVCLSLGAFPHYCTDPDVTWRNDRGCSPVVHYWADFQSVHGFRCYDNIHACNLALYTANAYSAEREMSASACIRSHGWFFIIASDGSKTVMPNTHAPETGARNRRFPGFWNVCHWHKCRDQDQDRKTVTSSPRPRHRVPRPSRDQDGK